MVDEIPTGIKVNTNNRRNRSEPRGKLTTQWLTTGSVVAGAVIAGYIFWAVFFVEKTEELVVDDGKTAYENDSARVSTNNDESGSLTDSLDRFADDSSTIAPIKAKQLSEVDRKQLAAAYEKYRDLEDEHKEALLSDRKAKLERVQGIPFIAFRAPLEKNKSSDLDVKEGLANHLGQSQNSPIISDALQRLQRSGEKAAGAASDLASLNSLVNNAGGGSGGDGGNAAYSQRLKEKEGFYTQKNRHDEAVEGNKFKLTDSPVWDITTLAEIVLSQPIDTRNPGEVMGVVHRDVYDSTGSYVVMPAFSKITGKYDSNLDYGNPTVQVIWERITFPTNYCQLIFEKASCSLPMKAIAHDRQGMAGLRGKYNQRILSTVGYASLFSVVSVLPAWLIDQIPADGEETVKQSDPDEIICVTEETSTTDTTSSVDVSESEIPDTQEKQQAGTTKKCGPRSTFANGGDSNTSLNFNNRDNTDSRDLYEDIANDVYDKVDKRLDTVYQRLANRRPYARIPAGTRFVLYPADDIIFPRGNYKAKRNLPIGVQ